MALGKNLKKQDKPGGGEQKETREKPPKKETAAVKEQVAATKEPEKNWLEAAKLNQLNRDVSEIAQSENMEMLVVFPIRRELYALPIEKVKEVVKLPRIAPIPQTPDYVPGVANIRGTVTAVLNLEKRIYGVEGSSESFEQPFVMVFKDEAIKAGILINGVPDTIAVKKSQIKTETSVINNLSKDDLFISGIVKRDKDMIILLDIHQLLETAES